MNPEQIKPMNDDVLLRMKPTHEAQQGSIWFKEDIDHSEIQYFHVVATGPDVREVKVGDLVIASWKRITPPFALDSTKKNYGVTSEKEIMAIMDE